jgi:hypothetical protein
MPAKNPKEYASEHYKQNKLKYSSNSKESRLRKKQWYNEVMKDKFCDRCGESDKVVLEWHHLDPSKKEASIAWMMDNRGRQTILEEISKCQCLCANCHRRVHYELRNGA